MVATLRGRLAAEEGTTLIELLTTLAILGTVLAGVVAMFVAGMRSEATMNERFQAQEQARTALATLRNEIRTACGYYNAGVAPGLPGPAMTSTQVTLGYCGTQINNFTQVQSKVTWCVVPSGGQYALYRQAGTTCNAAGGALRADKLISTVTACLPSAPPCPPAVFGIAFNAGDARPRLTVALDVKVSGADTVRAYHLDDAIALRNWRTDVTG